MTSKSLEDAMSACCVEPAIASNLVQMGWTVQTFACAAVNLEAFDRLWSDFFPDEEPSLLQKASLRAAFKMCQELMQPASPSPSVPTASASSDPLANSGTWAESFPPKLDATVIDQMKTKFLASYPSELVNHDTMPSTRLLSLVHHQLGKKQWAWIPWKYRLTMAKSEEVTSQRQTKMPKLEVASLHHLLVDEPPAIDISNTGFGVNAVRNLLAVHDMAVAMCGGAHLANLKAYSAKFLGFLTQKVDPESMLRCASITEAQAADRQIWAAIADLMSERGWDMDNCLHEFTHIRHDLPGLLQLRPRPPKPISMPSQPSFSNPSKGKGKGKPTKGKGKAKGKGKVQWLTDAKTKEGQWKQLCMRYQTGNCSLGDSCRFHHACAYPVNGQACGLDHGALQHENTTH